ncbi:radical SAM protein [Mycobacterium malmoense]|nr:radical SAM protein [Mycobacterium malmoense]QZA19018.1 radical SAM protein [Mycobacterium malmoense]
MIAAAGRVRREFFGRRVKLNYLVNMKSGMCPEDCNYCSQRLGSTAEILKYSWIDTDEAARHAQCAIDVGAKRVCPVAAGRGPSDRDIKRVADTIKDSAPAVEACVSLGLLKRGQADQLHEIGADVYNHNLNASADNYARICSTHTFDDRAATVTDAKGAGLSTCSGAIFAMGESNEDIVDVAMAPTELSAGELPHPVPRHPWAGIGSRPRSAAYTSRRCSDLLSPTSKSASPAAEKYTCAPCVVITRRRRCSGPGAAGCRR